MRYLKIFLLVTFIFSFNSFAQKSTAFKYISPKPNSKLLSRETNIIFSLPEFINEGSLAKQNLIQVTGSISGIHSGNLILSDDEKTIVFNPTNPFSPGETVTVVLNPGIQTITGTAIEPLTFSFSITPLEEPIRLDPFERLDMGITMKDLYSPQIPTNTSELDTIPEDFPEITIGTVNNPAPGNIFLANFRFGNTNTDGFFMMILDSTGYPVKYKRSAPFPTFDFDMQPNGLLSYADIFQILPGYGFSQFKVMDTSFAVVDSFQFGNGYQADFHDFRLLPNGHALMMAYDPQPLDMSQIVPGGDTNAIVIGGIIQELDSDKNVVFQWRSWDYVDITDSYIELTGEIVDYIHLNAVDFDNDENILISSRHFSEVTKISRQTGEIIWRLGGKNNEFNFINENPDNAPNYFSFQHDPRRISNGNLTLFDNGNQHSPPYSRGAEYELDEQNKTATLVWEYRHDPDLYGFATGSVQRLPNGNTLIGWGAASATGGPVLTEVHPDKSVAYELFFPLELASYRAFKYPWVSGLPSASVTRYEIFEGNTYEFNDPGDTTAVKIKFNSFQSILYNSVNVKLYDYAPKNPVFDGIAPVIYPQRFVVTPFGIDSLNVDIYFQLNHFPNVDNPNDIIVYERPNEDTGTFIPLTTIYNSNTNELKVSSTTKVGEFILGYPDVPVGVEELAGLPENFKLEQNYPNPFNPSTKIRYSLPVASNVTIKIYNTIGENVATLVDAYHSVGNYEVNWNAAFYVSGIYLYSLEAIPSDGSQMYRSVQKMILLK